MSDTPNVDEQPQHNLEDVVYDMLSETFCPDCDHPRCKRKVELYTSALQSIITQAKQQTCDDIVGLLPEEIEEEDGWDIYFTNGKEKGKVRPCCPGDDIAYAHNTCRTTTIKAINEYREGL